MDVEKYGSVPCRAYDAVVEGLDQARRLYTDAGTQGLEGLERTRDPVGLVKAAAMRDGQRLKSEAVSVLRLGTLNAWMHCYAATTVFYSSSVLVVCVYIDKVGLKLQVDHKSLLLYRSGIIECGGGLVSIPSQFFVPS